VSDDRWAFWEEHKNAFNAWVLKWNIGPGMNDHWRADNRARLEAAGRVEPKNYSGNDGIVGLGWLPILDKLAEDLIALGWDRSVAQIKEKFGGLRFYIDDGTDAMYARIKQAEKECDETCEYCGQPGKARGGGWIKTLCATCDEKHK
jgi:hypothetical protein